MIFAEKLVTDIGDHLVELRSTELNGCSLALGNSYEKLLIFVSADTRYGAPLLDLVDWAEAREGPPSGNGPAGVRDSRWVEGWPPHRCHEVGKLRPTRRELPSGAPSAVCPSAAL